MHNKKSLTKNNKTNNIKREREIEKKNLFQNIAGLMLSDAITRNCGKWHFM